VLQRAIQDLLAPWPVYTSSVEVARALVLQVSLRLQDGPYSVFLHLQAVSRIDLSLLQLITTTSFVACHQLRRAGCRGLRPALASSRKIPASLGRASAPFPLLQLLPLLHRPLRSFCI